MKRVINYAIILSLGIILGCSVMFFIKTDGIAWLYNKKVETTNFSNSKSTKENNKSTVSNDNNSTSNDVKKENSSEASNNVANKENNNNNSTVTNTVKKANGIDIGEKRVLNINQQIQKVWHYCAPTTVSMILSSRNINVDQFQLAKEMGTYEPFGTHNKDAIRILNKHMFGYETPQKNQAGYRLEHVSNVDSNTIKVFSDRIKENIANGYPMYYTFDVSKVYPGKKGEHNVIGTGYALKPNSEEIALLYYIDPSPNAQDATYGGLKVITPEKLLSSMLTSEEPNYGW